MKATMLKWPTLIVSFLGRLEMMNKLCMFCGNEVTPEDLTMEHFVPRSLWEKGRHPANLKTLPSHGTCNHSFSDDNDYFRDVMLFEDGVESHPKAKEVQHGAIARKLQKHAGAVRKNIRNVSLRDVSTPGGLYLGRKPTFTVDVARIERVLINVLKGVFYLSQGFPLPSKFLTSVSDCRMVDTSWLETTVGFMCPWQSFGDSVFLCRYVRSSSDPIKKFTCLMQFYEFRLFIGEAIDPQVLGLGGDLFVPLNKDSDVLVPRWNARDGR